jgi:hypothetical protein
MIFQVNRGVPLTACASVRVYVACSGFFRLKIRLAESTAKVANIFVQEIPRTE